MLVRLSTAAVFVIASVSCAGPFGDGGGAQPSGTPAPHVPVPRPGSQPVPTETPLPAGSCADLYDPDLLPTFELEIAPDDLEALQAEQAAGLKVFHPARFRYGAETREVRVRYRGNTSSCNGKLQLAIDFNEVDPDARFHGLRRINLDHGSCSTIEERLALAFVREELGIAASCANNARLVINGSYHGLFTNIEHVDREFLERNFEDPDGNLYEDARAEWKKTNESDPDTSDIDALDDAMDAASVDALADLDQAMRMWAADALMPACDNFWYFGRNFYVYNHPPSGFVWIPTDYDHALPLGWCWDWLPDAPGDKTAAVVLADGAWRARYVDALREAHARFRPEWFDERIELWSAQVEASAAEDPFLAGEPRDMESLGRRIRDRHALIESWLATEAD